jgi:predicted ATPase/DNA-binding NarL/FixJ family response regulator
MAEAGAASAATKPGLADLDALIGRDDDLVRLLADLAASRLVSLTGPGGCGKTRLAEAAVAALRDRGHDAWFVDLSAVENAELVGTAILTALRLEGSAVREPLDVVAERLAGHEAVLGLDNLEQIAGVDKVVSSVLRALPLLRVLTTSRVPLGVRGEIEVAVPTLQVPSERSADAVERSAAGALFLARSRALGRHRSLDEQTAADISTLLQMLDGLPLAIELAAARTRALTPAEIICRLEQHGPTAIDSTDTDRHRSLRAILDWTLALLSPTEFETLEAVSVCATFDLELAQALVPDLDAVDAIESLVALGLVARIGTIGTSSRFRLLETIRSTVLRGLGEERLHVLEDRHAAKFLDLADAWDRASAGGWTPDLVERLDAEADNIRRALDRLDVVAPRRSLSLGSRLSPFWQTRGRLAEGYVRFEKTSALVPEPSVELARAAARQLLTAAQGVIGPAELRAMTDRTIQMARTVGDPSALVAALSSRMWIAQYEEDAGAAVEAESEVDRLDLSDLDPRTRISLIEMRTLAAGAKYGLGSDQYVDKLRAQVAEASQAGWAGEQAIAAGNLAQILSLRGQHGEAAALAAEAASLFRALERPADLAWALSYCAADLAEIGRVAEAVEAASEAAGLAVSMRIPMTVADVLRTTMPVALANGQPLLAARLWGAVRRMHERGEYVLPPVELRIGQAWLARAATAASRVAVELAVRDGEADDRVDLLRALPELLRATSPSSASAPPLRHGELTRREVEILTLVGRGKSDPEIAEALFISPKTASVHVANVKAKLGLQSRLEVALRARDLGLVDKN